MTHSSWLNYFTVLVALALGKSFIMLKIIAENKKKRCYFHFIFLNEILIKLLGSFNMMKLLVILSIHKLKY